MKKIIFLSSLLLMPLSHDMLAKGPYKQKNASSQKKSKPALKKQVTNNRISSSVQAATIAAYIDFNKKQKQALIETYGLTICTNPELLQLFNTIKQDMGIACNIPLYLSTYAGAAGLYLSICSPNVSDNKYICMGISLNLNAIGNNHTLLIFVIAHELGHFLQFNGGLANYQAKAAYYAFFNPVVSEQERQEDSIKQEADADATAADYLKCQHCLEHVKHSYGRDSAKGYFSQSDHNPYINRAVEHNWSCPAHASIKKQSFLTRDGHLTGIAPIPFKATDFLPVRDRSNYPDSCFKTPPTF